MILQLLQRLDQHTPASSYDHPTAFYDSTDLSFQLWSFSFFNGSINLRQLPATIIQLHSTTHPTSASSYDPSASSTARSTYASFQLRSSSCILRLIRPQLPAMILPLLQRLDQPTPASSYDHPAAFYDSTDLSFQLRSFSFFNGSINLRQLPATIIQLHSTTQPTSASSYDPSASSTARSTYASFQLRSSSCILRLNRP